MEHNRNNHSRAARLRMEMTPWERRLWYCFLSGYPIRFQRQKCIDNFIVDFFCFQARLVVELDGGGHFDPESQRKDQERTKILESYGLTILRFNNREVDEYFTAVCELIDHTVKEKMKTLS